jgi:hypothetical protein
VKSPLGRILNSLAPHGPVEEILDFRDDKFAGAGSEEMNSDAEMFHVKHFG